MHISEKILMDKEGLLKEGPITIVAFGDSITQRSLLNEINYETVYWNLLRKTILNVRNCVPVKRRPMSSGKVCGICIIKTRNIFRGILINGFTICIVRACTRIIPTKLSLSSDFAILPIRNLTKNN